MYKIIVEGHSTETLDVGEYTIGIINLLGVRVQMSIVGFALCCNALIHFLKYAEFIKIPDIFFQSIENFILIG